MEVAKVVDPRARTDMFKGKAELSEVDKVN